ncbi:MAG TPA: type I DNA topoisomerase [candidate division Zixibacteria bacterium]|nr:type I DNA topoisomerase [candidate division Zixibacteria bacterium]
MAKGLVIVESPAKAKTIQKYLGKGYEVEASLGHIKDLPKKGLGVDVENNFETVYEVIPGKEKVVAKLRKMAKDADAVYLAPDPDREGEAIAAHLAEELGGNGGNGRKKGTKPIFRVTFNEITKKAVQDAFGKPRDIDWNLVDAQQTRRVLDRLVGFQVSPLLWDKVRRGLSAGRVQTVALRLIVEREREIKAFVPVEYWALDAHLQGAKPPAFDAHLFGTNPKENVLPNGELTEELRKKLEHANWTVASVEKRERRRNPMAPFTTSKFQQDASRKLGMSVKRAMMLAQRLYEGVELGDEGTVGLITYMRTDSVRVSDDAVREARELISDAYGAPYLPESQNEYKSKAQNAQDAHEAIRPTSVIRTPESVAKYLHDDELKVYKLIWQRFVASQMNPAVFDQTNVVINAVAGGETYEYRVTGSVLKFDGFLKVYEESKDAKDEEDEELKHKLPVLTVGQSLTLKELKPEQHFTEPPPRYNEASLVKELEERGIGRPSTYAAIISTIQERQYVQKTPGRGGKFFPTEIGFVVADLLVANLKDIFDTQFTAHMEEDLDEIEEGKRKWTDALQEFYAKFEQDLDYAQKHMENIKRMEKPTDEKCERCGSPLVIKWGKHGSFYACSAYDKKDPNSCTFTKENPIDLPDLDTADVQETTQEEYCENCGRPMVLKRGRFGQFMACTGYPDCKTTRRLDQAKKAPDVPLDEKCPQCGRQLLLRHGRYGEFVSCSGYPECKWVKQNYIGVKCPECKTGDIAEKKARKGNIFYGCSNYPDCTFTSAYKPVAEECPECHSPYLMEKTTKEGTFLVCPNTKGSAASKAKAKGKGKGKKKAADTPELPTCSFTKQIAGPAEPASGEAGQAIA